MFDYLRLNQIQPRLAIIIIATFCIFFLTVIPVELAANVGRLRALSLLLFAIATGTVMGVSILIGNAYSSQQSAKQIRSYDAIDFPVYYFSHGPDVKIVNATLGKSPFSQTPSIDFASSPFDQFGESKYPGVSPSPHCGNLYGQLPSEPTIWQCTPIYSSNRYVLYQEKVTYSNPNSVTPYDYYYFAIFNNQTVVWYNGSKLLVPTTTTPVSKIKSFYDSLEPVNLHSTRMTQILGNRQ